MGEEQGDLSMPLVSSDNTATRDDTHGIPILCTFFCALRDSRGDCWEDGGTDCKVRNKWGQRSLRKTVTTEQNLDYCHHRSSFLCVSFFVFCFLFSTFPPSSYVVIFPLCILPGKLLAVIVFGCYVCSVSPPLPFLLFFGHLVGCRVLLESFVVEREASTEDEDGGDSSLTSNQSAYGGRHRQSAWGLGWGAGVEVWGEGGGLTAC